MLSHDETKPLTEPSGAELHEREEQRAVKTGKKPFLEPTVSISLNILDATAFFGTSSTALDTSDSALS